MPVFNYFGSDGACETSKKKKRVRGLDTENLTITILGSVFKEHVWLEFYEKYKNYEYVSPRKRFVCVKEHTSVTVKMCVIREKFEVFPAAWEEGERFVFILFMEVRYTNITLYVLNV